MKFHATKLAAATALALAFSNVNAATISDNSVVINIVADGPSGASMLIDTGVDLADFQNGTVTSWTSDGIGSLTADIASFIAGGSNVQWWLAGRTTGGLLDKWFGTTKEVLDVAANDTGLLAFKSNANISYYNGNATVDGTTGWAEPIPAGDGSHFQNTDITALLAKHGADTAVTMVTTQTGLFSGTIVTELLDWNLASDGTLTYGTVIPVPAAVWLFGSGLLGLVGVARRRA